MTAVDDLIDAGWSVVNETCRCAGARVVFDSEKPLSVGKRVNVFAIETTLVKNGVMVMATAFEEVVQNAAILP